MGAHGDQALACSLFTGLVLGKDERGSLLASMGQRFPVQVVLEPQQEEEEEEEEEAALYKYPAAGYGAAQQDRGLFGGVGVGVDLATPSPYMSLNFLNGRGSFSVRPLSGLSHGPEAEHRGGGRSSACSPSDRPYPKPPCESHRDFPSYIGTSVIISNKR